MTATNDLPYRPSVGVLLINREGKVFVGRRADHVGAPEGVGQWWQMPQGGLDRGEDPEDAARRELEEETGVTRARIIGRSALWYNYDLPEDVVGSVWQGRYRGQTQLWFAARFEGEDSEIDLSPKRSHKQEFDAWKWVPHRLLPDLIVPFKRHVYESVVREFESLLLENTG